jgi:integrase
MVWTRPKTSSGVRIVPLIPAMVKLLELHSQIIEPNPHGLVWHHPDGRPISEKDDHTHWQHLLKAAGITSEGETLPIHAARHSTATMLQAHGVGGSADADHGPIVGGGAPRLRPRRPDADSGGPRPSERTAGVILVY